MVEPTDILDKMRITDPIERHRLLELMEAILMALALKHAGASESITAMTVISEIMDTALAEATNRDPRGTVSMPTRTM